MAAHRTLLNVIAKNPDAGTNRNKHLAFKPPEWLQFMLFVSCYALLDFGYFKIPVEMFSNAIYYHGLSSICADLINWASPLEHVFARQNHVLSARVDLEIVRGCDGAGALFLIISAILVFPAKRRRKVIGLAWGIGLIYSLNLLRISALYFVIAYRPAWFLLIHTYLAPSLMVIVGCGYFAWWAFTANNTAHEPA